MKFITKYLNIDFTIISTNEVSIEKVIELVRSRIDLIYKAISNPSYTNLHELTVDLACAFGMAKGSKYITHVESNEKEVN